MSALCGAIVRGDVGKVISIVKGTGAEYDVTDKNGQSPLHYAAVYGNEDICKVLISEGFDCNCRTVHFTTPLHYSSHNGNLGVVLCLLSSNAFVNSVNNENSTPLHYAALQGRLEICQALIAAGADVNAIDNKSQTPLDLACSKNNCAVASHLIACGANVCHKDSYDVEPLMRITFGNLPVITLEEYDDPNTDETIAKMFSSSEFYDFSLSGVNAHKCILAAKSLTFRSYFEENPNIKEIDVSEIGAAVSLFVGYLYTDRLARSSPLDTEVLIETLRLAIRWNVELLVDDLSVILSSRLTEQNIIPLWKLLVSEALHRYQSTHKIVNECSVNNEVFLPLSVLCPILFPFFATLTMKYLRVIGGGKSLVDVLTSMQIGELIEHVVLPEKCIVLPFVTSTQTTPTPSKISTTSTNVPTSVSTKTKTESSTVSHTPSTSSKQKHSHPHSTSSSRHSVIESSLDTSDLEIARRILEKLMTNSAGKVFNQPVEPLRDGAPDYFRVIKRPMDFGTIKVNLRKQRYRDLDRFASDVRLVFKNGRAYNPPESFVCQCADTLSPIFDSEWAKVIKDRSKRDRKSYEGRDRHSTSSTHSHTMYDRRNKEKEIKRKDRRDSYLDSENYGGEREIKRINPDILNECKAVVDELLRHEFSSYFDHPVDPERDRAPDYYMYVKKPMDLGSVRSKLRKNQYRSTHQFAEDIRLIWSNCKKYNPPGSVIVAYADALSTLFETRYKKVKEKQTGLTDPNASLDSKPKSPPTNTKEQEAKEMAAWLCEKLQQLDPDQQNEAVKLVHVGEDDLGTMDDEEYEFDLSNLTYEQLVKLKEFVLQFHHDENSLLAETEPDAKRMRMENPFEALDENQTIESFSLMDEQEFEKKTEEKIE